MKKLFIMTVAAVAFFAAANAQTAQIVNPNIAYEAVWWEVDDQFEAEIPIKLTNYSGNVTNNNSLFSMYIYPNSNVSVQPYCYITDPGYYNTSTGIVTVRFCIVPDQAGWSEYYVPYTTYFKTEIRFQGVVIAEALEIYIPAGRYYYGR